MDSKLKTIDLGNNWILYPDLIIEGDVNWSDLGGYEETLDIYGDVIHSICFPIHVVAYLTKASPGGIYAPDIVYTKRNKKTFTCMACKCRSSTKTLTKYNFIMSSYKSS